ncbi:MAG: uS8 family ribosomal protein [Microgenomates group bacterium]
MENSVIDLIIRIKNGYLAGREKIISPYSKFKEAVVKKLIELGFVKSYSLNKDKFNEMTVELLYKDGQPALTDVEIFSKPGRRFYVSYKDLKPVMSGYGYSIISSPIGIITNIEAKLKKVGGELLFNIW